MGVFAPELNSVHNSVIVAKMALGFWELYVIIIFLVFPVVLFLLVFAIRLVIETDSCLDREISQQCFTIAVEVVI